MVLQQDPHWSKSLADLLGEYRGRSVSRVLADGLDQMADDRLGPDRAMDLVHLGIGAATIHAASTRNWKVLLVLALVGIPLWALGQQSRTSG